MKYRKLINAIKKTKPLLIVFILLTIIPCLFFGFHLQETTYEYHLKAVYIYNFSQYLTWPQDTPSDNFIIAVIGQSEIIIPLNEIATKEKVGTRNIVIRQFRTVGDIEFCHILFIPKTTKTLLPHILTKVKNTNILLISENEGFARQGTAINFVFVENKIKFEINQQTLEQVGIDASSQLLRLAILIKETQ